METHSAAFITMLMDRLQTVEAAHQEFQETNEQLQRELQDVLIANEHLEQRVLALESSLHLELGSSSFNDGFILRLGFTLRADWLEHPLDTSYCHPLDALHYNATAFYHSSTVRMRGVPSFEINIGKDFKPTSVRQLLKAIKTWCREPASDPGRPGLLCTNAEIHFDEDTEFEGLEFVETDEESDDEDEARAAHYIINTNL